MFYEATMNMASDWFIKHLEAVSNEMFAEFPSPYKGVCAGA